MKHINRKSIAFFVTMFAFVVGLADLAGAQTTTTVDPTGGAAEALSGNLTDWIQNHAVPLVVALLTIGIVIGLLVKWGKRGAKSA